MTKLDTMIDGTRYRSNRALGYSTEENWGVRKTEAWICRGVVVLQTYSIWDRGDGCCVGYSYQVIDPRDAWDRQTIANMARHLKYGRLHTEASLALLALARKHAPEVIDTAE